MSTHLFHDVVIYLRLSIVLYNWVSLSSAQPWPTHYLGTLHTEPFWYWMNYSSSYSVCTYICRTVGEGCRFRTVVSYRDNDKPVCNKRWKRWSGMEGDHHPPRCQLSWLIYSSLNHQESWWVWRKVSWSRFSSRLSIPRWRTPRTYKVTQALIDSLVAYRVEWIPCAWLVLPLQRCSTWIRGRLKSWEYGSCPLCLSSTFIKFPMTPVKSWALLRTNECSSLSPNPFVCVCTYNMNLYCT